MPQGATPGPATSGRQMWAWIGGLIGVVLAILVITILTRRRPGAPPRAAVARGDYRPSPANLDSASVDLQRAVSNRMIPGAALAIGDRSRIVELSGYGRVGWKADDDPVSADSTIYDLASLTKAVATTSATLLLIQDGRIKLDDPIDRWLPEFKGRWKERVTWRHLLTHTAGLPAGAKVRGRSPNQRLENIIGTPLDEPPGNTVEYSDVSAIILWAAAERVAGEPLPVFLERRLWRPLGMRSTAFWPGLACENCAPTQMLKSGDEYRGKPSDPLAHKVGMPTGNAGLFSTAHDLARFASMMANGGVLGNVRIFRQDLVRDVFTQQPHAGHRTLGWTAFCPAEDRTQQQECEHPIAYGHTGWTGTSLWIDPVRGVWVVILCNRSYNVKHPPSLEELRADVFLDAAGLDSGDDGHDAATGRADSAHANRR